MIRYRTRMTREEAIEELTPRHMAAHDALGVHLREQGYMGAPHWLCCSSDAKSKGFDFLYKSFPSQTKVRIDALIEELHSDSIELHSWRKRELAAGDARGWSN